MKAYLGRRYHFSAAHRLHAASLSKEENRTIYGKCNNPFGHGHNYTVEVLFSGEIDPVTGMVVNLAELDAFAKAHVLDQLDLANLNTLDRFTDQVPSTENLVMELYSLFAAFKPARLESIKIEETSNNSFVYPGPIR